MRMRRRFASWGLGIVAGVVAGVVATPCFADPSAADIVTAKTAMREGREARDRGDWKAAVASFRAAFTLVPTPKTGNELAQALEKSGRLVEAREVAFAVVKMPVKEGEPESHVEGRKAATQIAAAIDARIPRLTLSVEGAPKRDAVSVSLDDEEVPVAALSAARAIDPGHHTLVVRADGYPEQRREFDVAEQAKHEERFRFEGPPKPKAAPVAPVVTVVVPPRTDAGTVLAYVGFSLAAAGALAGAVTGGYVLAAGGDLREACPTNHCPPAQASTLATAETLATVSTAAFISAGVGLALGVTGFAIRPKREKGAVHVSFGVGGLVGSFE